MGRDRAEDRRRWEDNIKIDLEICERMWDLVNTVMNLVVPFSAKYVLISWVSFSFRIVLLANTFPSF
jgi:hypothetical protein